MSRIKVLMLIDNLHEGLGGAERFAVGLATHLPADRYEVWVCTTRQARGRLPEMLEEGGVRHINLDRRRRRDDLRFLRLARLIRRERFDVLHAHMFGSNYWGTALGRLCRVPVVIAHEQTWNYEGRPLRKFLDGRFVGRLATRFIAVSDLDRDRMIGIEKAPADKVLVIPNAYIPRTVSVDGDLRAELGLAADVPLIGTVAMLRPQKSLETLIDAYALVVAAHPGAQLVIGGDGVRRSALEEHARAAGLADRVHFLGEREDVDRILRGLDVAAMSSDFEGTPLFAFECLSNGAPLVATDVGGMRDIGTPGEELLLVPPRDPAALANAIGQLLGDPQLRARISEAGLARARAFSIAAITERFCTLYESLLAERVPAR
jgi:glycosyltransferase involved in cell wall biosynthesis